MTQVLMTKWIFLSNSQKAGHDATPCNLTCSGCGTMLETEGDFARHFVIRDRRYLNLGNCPVKDPSIIRYYPSEYL